MAVHALLGPALRPKLSAARRIDLRVVHVCPTSASLRANGKRDLPKRLHGVLLESATARAIADAHTLRRPAFRPSECSAHVAVV